MAGAGASPAEPRRHLGPDRPGHLRLLFRVAPQAARGASAELPGRRDGSRISHDAAVHGVPEFAAGARILGGLPSYLGIAYTAVLPSFVAYLFFNRGVEFIGAGPAGQSMHLMPLFGSVLAVLFLHERFQAYHRVRDRDDRGGHPAGLIQTGATASGDPRSQHNVIRLVRAGRLIRSAWRRRDPPDLGDADVSIDFGLA